MRFFRAIMLLLFVCVASMGHAGTLSTKQSALKFTLQQERAALHSLYGRTAVQHAQKLYAGMQFQPLWQDSLFKNPSRNLLTLFDDASTDGLNPAHYYPQVLNDLEARYAGNKSMGSLVKKDVFFTAALFKYLSDLNYGQTQPDIYIHRKLRTDKTKRYETLANLFMQTLASRDMAAASRSSKLQHPEYLALRAALAQYRTKLDSQSSWPTVPRTRTKLTAGMTDTKRVPLLIKRLEAQGFLPADTIPTSVITPQIADAVTAFQAQHGLKADGVIGPATLRALNTPLDMRANQIKLALERWRWLPDDLGAKHVRVNIAGFQLRAFDGKAETLAMPIVVGKKKHATPLMHTIATDVTFNPYWYIPESIVQSKVIPKLIENPSAFYRKNYEGSIGSYRAAAINDVDSVLAAAANQVSENSPDVLRIRQRPGRNNALGRARVNILNSEAIYLHDTPYKSAFRREYRALSHGCIRLSDPQAVVNFLLAEHPTWLPEETEKRFTLKKPKTPEFVTLNNHIPVYLIYSTAWVQNGKIHFGRDVYDYDAPLLAEIKAPAQGYRLAQR